MAGCEGECSSDSIRHHVACLCTRLCCAVFFSMPVSCVCAALHSTPFAGRVLEPRVCASDVIVNRIRFQFVVLLSIGNIARTPDERASVSTHRKLISLKRGGACLSHACEHTHTLDTYPSNRTGKLIIHVKRWRRRSHDKG